jgi:hypothetical protein
VSELARSCHSKEYPFESTGIKDVNERIQLEGGDIYKGQLHYTAEFFPALALNGVKFEHRPNELQRAAEGANADIDGGDATDDTPPVSTPPVPEGITAWHPVGGDMAEEKPSPSTDTDPANVSPATATATAAATATENTQEEAGPQLVELSRDELMEHQSGILVVNIISGTLSKKARVDVLLDDGYWPVISTVKSLRTNACWEHVGEAFVRELDFGQVTLHLNESSQEKDDIIAEWKGQVKSFLHATLVCPYVINLTPFGFADSACGLGWSSSDHLRA